MRIVLRGRDLEEIRPLLLARGVSPVEDKPDLVLCHGGDGALLGAEREFPHVPKYPIRDRETAELCPAHRYECLLDDLMAGRLKRAELIKLRGSSGGRELRGMNDIMVHNLNRVSAIRYQVWIDGEPYSHEVVGDGVCVSTPHGSTAYYRSITHSVFRLGIGLAFSNSTEPLNHLVLPEDTVVKIKVTRGPALLVADNDPTQLDLAEGAEVVIAKDAETAVVLGLDTFMCETCRKLRHPGE